MSLGLDLGTLPEGTTARTDFDGEFVEVGDLQISTADVCQLALYVLTNTDLWAENDPRLHFMNQLAKLNVIDGHMAGRKRLG